MLHANKRNLANEACVRPESDWVDERWTWLAETSESFSLQSSYLFFSPKLQAIWKASSTFFFNMSAIIKLALHFKHTIFTHHPVLPLLDVFSLLFVCGCYRCCRYLLNSRIFVGLFLRIFLVFLLFFFFSSYCWACHILAGRAQWRFHMTCYIDFLLPIESDWNSLAGFVCQFAFLLVIFCFPFICSTQF